MWSIEVVTVVVACVQYVVQFGVAVNLVQQAYRVVAQLVGQRSVLRLSNIETETKRSRNLFPLCKTQLKILRMISVRPMHRV